MDEALDWIDALPNAIFWGTDAEGTITFSVGGALRTIGLVRDATVGRHVEEFGLETLQRFQAVMAGMAGIVREHGAYAPAIHRQYVVAYGPWHKDKAIAGMVCMALDITGLQEHTVEKMERDLAEILPIVEQLAQAQTERIKGEAQRASARAKLLENRAERRWLAIRQSAEFLADKAGVPLSIVFTALALYLASALDVIEHLKAFAGWGN